MPNFTQIFKLDDTATLAKKPRDRMNALLEAKDTNEAVQALSPIEFYDLFHAVGPNDAMVLLEYAAPEQVQTCLDLDIWRDDQMSDKEIASYVEQMLTLPDEKFAELWREIDPELMALYLHRNIHLYKMENKDDEVDIPESEGQNVAQTPDFTYWVAYPEDPDKAELLRQLIDRLYAILGVDKAWSTLEGMNWEMETDLEENAYHFRTERIREFGFMPREEAAALFTKIDIASEVEAIKNETSAELYIRSYSAPEKLDASLARIDNTIASNCYLAKILTLLHHTDEIRIQLLSLAQQIATFDGFQPHEEQGFDDSMLLAVAYASIGLEYTSEHDDDVAVRILTHVALRRLVTLGFNMTLELHRKAKLLVSRGHLTIIEDNTEENKLSLLTTAQRDAVEGMLETRPRPASSSLVPFISVRDIQSCAAIIADVATRELFFGEALHKTRDDISLLAYTHELIQGVENVNFDNVAITFLTRRYLKCADPWNVFTTDDLPNREDVIKAIDIAEIRSLFKSSINESTIQALMCFSRQLRAQVDDIWPQSEIKPDPQLVSVILIAEPD